MFRLADFDEGTPLYKYLSTIASHSILEALDDVYGNMPTIEDFYATTFSTDVRETDFFKGLSTYITDRADVKEDEFGSSYTDDTRAGLQLMYLKTNRMKEKMRDPSHYYTFDLFEEYLFNEMIAVYYSIYVEADMREESEKKELALNIKKTARGLIETYSVEEELAEEIAESAWKPEKMGIDDSDLYFWDDDFAIVFADGFVSGIKSLVGGSAAMMGYGYEDVCSIFTDAGIKAPLLLVGTETAFDTVGEVTQKNMAEAIKNMPVPEPTDAFKEWLEEEEEEDDLPFS